MDVPSVNEFRTAYRFLLKSRLEDFIREKKRETNLLIKNLEPEYIGSFSVEISPFPSPKELKDKIDAFGKVREMKLTMKQTNSEKSSSEALRGMGVIREEIEAETFIGTFYNKGAGLIKDSLLSLIESIKGLGKWELNGVDKNNTEMVADEEKTKLSDVIDYHNDRSKTVLEMVKKFNQLVTDKIIPPGEDCDSKLWAAVYEKFNPSDIND
jgi:hypothetical protein